MPRHFASVDWSKLKLPVFRWLWPVCRLSGALVLLTLVCACGEQSSQPRLAEGEEFPQITLNKLSGGTVSISAFRGKLLVLNVWSTQCIPCREEMPDLERLSKTLDPQRFVVIGLSVQNDAYQVRKFLEYNGITFENFFDRDEVTLKQLDITVYPVTLLIAPDGILIQRVMGRQEWSSPAVTKVLEDMYHGRSSRIGGWWYGGHSPSGIMVV